MKSFTGLLLATNLLRCHITGEVPSATNRPPACWHEVHGVLLCLQMSSDGLSGADRLVLRRALEIVLSDATPTTTPSTEDSNAMRDGVRTRQESHSVPRRAAASLVAAATPSRSSSSGPGASKYRVL